MADDIIAQVQTSTSVVQERLYRIDKSFGFWNSSPTVTNDTYLQQMKLKYYKFQVLMIIIIIIIQYISIIY